MDKKIAVLGLGPSLSLYTPEYDLTIGVNDIWSRVKTDYVVCVDKREGFSNEPERLKVIDECKPIKFYTQFPTLEHPEVKDYSDREDYEHIELLPYFPNSVAQCQLHLKQLPLSLCSPFIATVIAYKFHQATEIHLFGVDMTNHPHLNGKTCERIKLHFYNLKIALAQKGCKLIIHGAGILQNI